MAYSIVPTVATGDLWTAANHNTYIRDNFAAGVPDIFTTKGDLAVATAADAASRLAVGSNGYHLEAQSGEATGMLWRGQYWCEGYKTTTQSINSGSRTIVNFEAEQDPQGIFTTGSSAKVTFPIDGVYLIQARVWWTDYVPAANTVHAMYLYGNGAEYRTLDARRAEQTTAAWRVVLQGMYIWAWSATNYADIRVEQNSGSAQTIASTTYIYCCRIK